MASEQASLAPARSSAAAPRRTAAPSPRPDPHFVDLAIDAVPPRPMEPRGLRTVPGELDSLLGAENDRLPVLQDVVEPHAISTMPGRLDDGDTTERATPAFTDTHPLPAWAEPSQPAGPRSRLMRMKERGLFKNT